MEKIGFAEGKCSKCGKVYYRPRPAAPIICDCYKYCPICGKEMQPFTPDTTATTYTKGDLKVLFICNNHSPPFKSTQQPIEVYFA